MKHPNIDPNALSMFQQRQCLPLTIAMYNRNLDIIKMLVAHTKIDVNADDEQGLSVMDNLIIKIDGLGDYPDIEQDYTILRYLVRFGVMPYLEGDDGDESLYELTLSVLEKTFDDKFLSTFLDYTNDDLSEEEFRTIVHARDADDATLLMYFVGRGAKNAVERILAYGANPLVQDKAGNTALSIAETILARFSDDEGQLKEISSQPINDMLYQSSMEILLSTGEEKNQLTERKSSISTSPKKKQKRLLDGKEEEEPAPKKQYVKNLFDNLPNELLVEIVNYIK